MGGRPGRGAVIGLGIGLVLLLILFASPLLSGDDEELVDPLVFAGVPLLVIGAAVGALVGVRPHGEDVMVAGSPGAVARGRSRSVVAVVAVAAVLLAVWTMLWAMGFVGVSPLGLG